MSLWTRLAGWRLAAVALAVLAGTAAAVPLGTGADGALNVAGTHLVDSVRTSLTGSVGAGSSALSVGSATGFGAGDELMIISMQGTSGAVGRYEFARVGSAAGSSIVLSNPLAYGYDGAADAVAVQRVPNYTDVTVASGGVLTASAWGGTGGGVVAFRATGTVNVAAGGAISADGLGFGGGAKGVYTHLDGTQGESYRGPGGVDVSPNDGGGGGGRFIKIGGDVGGGGGGAGHATAGTDGKSYNTTPGSFYEGRGLGGLTCGSDDPTAALFLGSGGGGGATDQEGGATQAGTGGDGGAGGGLVYVVGNHVTIAGTVSADAAVGSPASNPFGQGGELGGGGGGAGGTVYLGSPHALPGTPTADGGAGGIGYKNTNPDTTLSGGDGGQGRVFTQFLYDPLDPVIPDGITFHVDEVRSKVTAVGANSLDVPDSSGFAPGDEVLIIDSQGTGAGTYEFANVTGTAAGKVFVDGITNAYPGGDAVAVQVVPHYNSLTVEDGGTVTAHAYDGETGGIVAFRATGAVNVAPTGTIGADGLGYRGGAGGVCTLTVAETTGTQGESIAGPGAVDHLPNDGGGGGGRYNSGANVACGGGGAGHVTQGDDGSYAGAGVGGTACGRADSRQLFLGSGGGGGGADGPDGDLAYGGDGGSGGGIIYIEGNPLNITGLLSAGGAVGQPGTEVATGGEGGGGGGGAGGTVLTLSAQPLNTTPPSVTGGAGGLGIWNNSLVTTNQGGDGGDGRVLQRFSFDPTDPVVLGGMTLHVDEVRSQVTAVGANSLDVPDSSAFAPGDEVLIIDTHGTAAGTHEFATVTGTAAGKVFVDSITNAYPAGDTVAVQVVPHYNSLTVESGGTVTADPYDGQTGGIVAFRVDGLLDVQAGGLITADGLGYRGGASVPATSAGAHGWQGESYDGTPQQGVWVDPVTPGDGGEPNFGGGGAGMFVLAGGDVAGAGGGGSYSDVAPGTDGVGPIYGGTVYKGIAGAPYGDAQLQSLFLGSGGGSGGADYDSPPAGASGAGGDGGGIVYIQAGSLQLAGSATSRGSDGGDAWGNSGNETGGGGGGAGGSLYIETPTGIVIYPSSTLAEVPGGAGGTGLTSYSPLGGSGGVGRIHATTWRRLPPANSLLFEDFESPFGLGGWHVVDAPTPRDGPSNWYIASGELVNTSNIHSTADPFGSIVWSGDTDWTDYIYSGRMRNTDNDGFGIVFRYQDPDNFYRIRWSNDFGTHGVRFDKVVGGALTLIDLDTRAYAAGSWYDFEVMAFGEHVAFWLDGEQLFDYTSADLSHGAIGVLTDGSQNVYFDNLRVLAPEPATLCLLGAGLLALARRRRRA